MSTLSRVGYLIGLSLLLLSCGAGTEEPQPTPTSTLPTAPTSQRLLPTVTPTTNPVPTFTRIPSPTPPSRTETTTIKIDFDTYETEETVRDELGQVPGILSLLVTQLEVTVTYNPDVINRADIIEVLEENPEVRIREEP